MGREMVMTSNTDHKEQNVSFCDFLPGYTNRINSVIDHTRTHQDTYDATLADFFARPIKIDEIEWTIGSTLFHQFDPWSLYFDNPRISNRMSNFNLLRSKLHVKFLINGNGFMYSRALVSYLPFSAWDFLSESVVGTVNDLIQESQCPHLFLNPTTSTGGTLILPFFWPGNNLPMSLTPAAWSKMGRLTMRSFDTLRHANGATGVSTISVFAWAEDIEMNVLTSFEPSTLTPQAGNEIDEANSKGYISGPATSVAGTARALSKVPIIGPYAMATDVAATAVAGIAKSFGYSRPTRTADPEPLKPAMTSSLALTTVVDTLQRLTLDDKQELSIDPKIAGLDSDDPLTIRKIASIESWITQFKWQVGVSPGTLLWNARVLPSHWAITSPNKLHFPACCIASLPFTFWTGTMKFRFQVMSSAYHKGRLKITYDPNYIANEEFNTMYTKVVDISSETDFTISISNGQDLTLLSQYQPDDSSTTVVRSTTRYVTKGAGNGVIGVSILNELTTPNSTITNDIWINVFISMGDDFQVFMPDDTVANYSYEPQSGLEVPDSFENMPDCPEPCNSKNLGPTMDNESDITKVFIGESIASYRALLKRYSLHSSLGGLTTGQRRIRLRACMYPYLKGRVAGAIHLDEDEIPINYCNNLNLHLITNCFSGWRGSIRYKLIPRGFLETAGSSFISVERQWRDNNVLARYQVSDNPIPTFSSRSDAAANAQHQFSSNGQMIGYKGKAVMNFSINPTLEFEMPFYSRFRFIPGKIENYTGLSTIIQHNLSSMELDYYSALETSSTLDFYVAAGEDFTCYFWSGCPPMYYTPDVINPSALPP